MDNESERSERWHETYNAVIAGMVSEDGGGTPGRHAKRMRHQQLTACWHADATHLGEDTAYANLKAAYRVQA